LGSNLENLSLTGSSSIDGTGNTGNNIIIGNMGNNVLDGKQGADTLSGLGGADTFYFSTKASLVSGSATHITDFNVSEKDLIKVNGAAFGIDSKTNPAIAKIADSKDLDVAMGSSSTFVYDSSTGNLYWNQNGSAAGAGSGGVFAVLDNKADLSETSISVV
jgi:Ca2+-binding RTX toxin-like protein